MTYLRKLGLLCVTLWLISSCQKSAEYYDGLYVTGADKVNPSISITLSDEPVAVGITVSATAKVTKNVVLSMSVNPEKVDAYNAKFNKNYVLLPRSCYSLKDSILSIVSGSYATEQPLKVEINSREGLDEGKTYLLPISIEKVTQGGLSVIEGSRTLYVVVNQVIIASAADLGTSGYLHVDFSQASKYNTRALSAITFEARVWINKFNGPSMTLNSVMGMEENFLLRFNKNHLQIAQGTYNPVGTKDIPTKQWVHVAGVYDGSSMSIYINGELDVSIPASLGTIDLMEAYKDNTFTIGISAGQTSRCLNGMIAEARVWAKARTAAELKNNMCFIDPTSEGLVAYWRFNAIKETKDISDLTGNGYSAVYKGWSALKYVEGVHCPE